MSPFDELEQLEREATTGPWAVEGNDMIRTEQNKQHKGYGIVCRNKDANFIAALRNHAKTLIAVARAAETLDCLHSRYCATIYDVPLNAEQLCDCGLDDLKTALKALE